MAVNVGMATMLNLSFRTASFEMKQAAAEIYGGLFH
jgi:hypothetical protein